MICQRRQSQEGIRRLRNPIVEYDGHKITPGEVYLVEESKPSLFFDIFSEAMIQDVKGLLITREFPERLRASYNLEKASIVWLTHVVGRDCIEPTQTNLILNRIVSFTKDNSPCLIMLDGIEYLINQNSFDVVIGFLNHVRDLIIIKNSVLVVAVDPNTLESKELALVERNLQVIKSSGEGKSGPLLSLESGVLRVMKMPNSKQL